MAKYIIDIPDEEETMWEGFNGDLFIPITMNKGTRTWVNTNLKVTPYTEPDREADEMWDFVNTVYGLSDEELYEIFDDGNYCDHSYQEAKDRYDAWKKEKDEIHVGDEVETESGNKACVLYENPDGTQMFVFKADGTAGWWSKCAIHKTGKNHPEVAELLKKMREEE